MSANPEMADYINNLALVMPLDPRGAFFGGRTNAIVLERAVKEGEKIKYADFVSLYPTVQKVFNYIQLSFVSAKCVSAGAVPPETPQDHH